MKPYLTRLQLAQFAVVFAHSLQLLFVPDCGYPREHAYALMALASFFMVLFAHFYVRAYCGGGEKEGIKHFKAKNGVVKEKGL